MNDWFVADKKGLAASVAQRGYAWIGRELVQNGLDQNVTFVRFALEPIPRTPQAWLVCEDDDPKGFENLDLAWTLYADTGKRRDPTKSGQFTTGEKLVLSLAKEATIATTSGTVTFDESGRRTSKVRRDRGSLVRIRLPLTRDAQEEILDAVRHVIPREGVTLTVNGEVVPSRPALKTLEATLPTVYADQEGMMRRTARKTKVTLHEVLPGETPHICELGIPVVELLGGEKWHVNIHQRVPVNSDRDNVTPAYLATLRALVLNAMSDEVQGEDAAAPWVKAACSTPDAAPEAVLKMVQARYGKDFVGFDPVDREANGTAGSKGYALIPSNALTAQERDHLRSLGQWHKAGEVFPTKGAGAACRSLTPEELTNGMIEVANYAKVIARELIGAPIRVRFIDSKDTPVNVRAQYGSRTLTFNVTLLEGFFSSGITEEVDELILHELAHEYVSDHRSHEYHQACNRLGARLAHLLVTKPEILKGFLYAEFKPVTPSEKHPSTEQVPQSALAKALKLFSI